MARKNIIERNKYSHYTKFNTRSLCAREGKKEKNQLVHNIN